MKLIYHITVIALAMIAMTACRTIDYRGAVRRAKDLAIRHPESSVQGLVKPRDLKLESIHFQTHAYGDLIEVTFRLRGAPQTNRFGQTLAHFGVHMKSNGELYNFIESSDVDALDREFGEYMAQ